MIVAGEKIQAKQRLKILQTHLLGLQRVNGIYFIFFTIGHLIDSFLAV